MELFISRTLPNDSIGPIRLRIVGSLDLTTVRYLLDAAAEAVLLSDALVIDASGIDFVDAAGVCIFAEIADLARREEAEFRLESLSPQLERALAALGGEEAWSLAGG